MTQLLIQNGEQRETFNAPFVVGRGEEADFVVEDDYASQAHAQFVPTETGWAVVDLGTTNGTYVDTSYQRIYAPQLLRQGAQVRIGRTVLTVVMF